MNRFGILGKSLKHTLSPLIHSELFRLSGFDGEFEVFEFDTLNDFYQQVTGLYGYCVTIPYKEEVYNALESIDESAEIFRSVNVVDAHSGVAKGYNTDCYGFCSSVAELGDFRTSSVLLLGAGGVGRMIAGVYKDAQLDIAVRNTSDSHTLELVKSLGDRVNVVDIAAIPKKHYDLIVNATPVGMYPDNDSCVICNEVIRQASAVYDTVYNPLTTTLVAKALSYNIPAKAGLDMLVYQAVKAHEIWYGGKFRQSDIANVIAKAEEAIR